MKRSKRISVLVLAGAVLFTSCAYEENGTLRDPKVCLKDCGYMQTCINGTDQCTPKLGVGAACAYDEDCISGRCHNDMCTCGELAPCGKGKFCNTLDGVGTCTEKLPRDAECLSDIMCASNVCRDSVCYDLNLGGEHCTQDGDCKSNVCMGGTCTCSEYVSCSDASDYCQFIDSTCQPKVDVNKQCFSNDMCKSGYCGSLTGGNGTTSCLATYGGGATCMADYMCKTGLCSKQKCSCSEDVKCVDEKNEYCDYETGTCVARTKGGEACTEEEKDKCASGVCDNGKCTCNTSDDCSSDTYCVNSTCKPRALGAGHCSKDEECISNKCNNGLCECNVLVGAVCTDNMSCGGDNRCYGNATDGACQFNEQCESRRCYSGQCKVCEKDSDCGDNRVCDSGACRDIVPCPDASDKKCFVTLELYPNSKWLGTNELSSADNSYEEPRDYLGPNFTIGLPKSTGTAKNDISFCVDPIYDEGFMKVLNPLMDIMNSSLTVPQKNALVGMQIFAITQDQSFSAYTKMADYLKESPYAWAIFFENAACKQNEGEDVIEVCRGAVKKEECQCKSMKPDKILPYSNARYEALYAHVVGKESKDSPTVKMRVLQEVLGNFMDPRIFYRLQSGCMELSMGKEMRFELKKNGNAEKWANHNVHLAFNFENSLMMQGEKLFELSLAPDYMLTSEMGNKDRMTTALSNNVVSLPSKANSSRLVATYDASNMVAGEKGLGFVLKPNYIASTNDASGYTPIACDNRYVMSYYHNMYDERPTQLCESKDSCSYNEANVDSKCPVSVFTRLHSIQVYVSIDENKTPKPETK